MAVDWEQRIDFDRLRRERLTRIKELLAKSEMGAVLCFDMNNVRYITATHIGTWAQDKISRFTLLPQGDEPILWDFGSAAKHHQLNCPWLGERSRAGIPLMRGAMTPEMGRSEDVARKIRVELESRGLHKEPLGVDVVEPPILFALQKEGITVVDGQQLMSNAREIKTQDEISLLTQAAGMVDAALLRPVQGDEARHARERCGRARRQAAVRDGLGVCGGRQRHFRRAVQPASARVLRSHHAARRPGLLRHPALVHGLSHVLLPLLRDQLRSARAGGRIQAVSRLSRRGDRSGAARDAPPPRSRRSGRVRRSSASRTKKPRLRCRWGTASASRSGRSR
jgi:hypothetical protein